MYLCSGIKQVVNVINQTNRKLGMLMQNVFHSEPLIKQEAQGVKYLMEFTEVKGWSARFPWVGSTAHSLRLISRTMGFSAIIEQFSLEKTSRFTKSNC